MLTAEQEKTQDKRDFIHLLAILKLLVEGDPPGSDLITGELGPVYKRLYARLGEIQEGLDIVVTEDEVWSVGVKIQLTYKGETEEWEELALEPEE